MTSMKIDAHSQVGELIAADIKSGALKFDEGKGAFFKASTQQEYLLTNKDRLVRWDEGIKSFSEYNSNIKNFLPVNALQDGEQVDRSRKLKKNDILAKPTWKQWAGETSLIVAQGAVTGAALGAVGGAIYGVVTHRGSLSSGNVASNNSAVVHTRSLPVGGGIASTSAALHAPGPFHPGDLTPPGHVNINVPPSPGLTPGQAAQEQAAQGAFAAAGAIVGGACAGPLAPVGAIVGGIIGAGLGALWNEAVR